MQEEELQRLRQAKSAFFHEYQDELCSMGYDLTVGLGKQGSESALVARVSSSDGTLLDESAKKE
jgi:hypothetical protein